MSDTDTTKKGWQHKTGAGTRNQGGGGYRTDYNSVDDYPTPPWATRVLMEHEHYIGGQRAWDPCCGRGYMVKVLQEYYTAHGDDSVLASDKYNYHFGIEQDWFGIDSIPHYTDIVTNPPYNMAQEFILHALKVREKDHRHGGNIAVLVRSQFIHGKDRWSRLYGPTPPTKIFAFTERVMFNRGKVAPKGASAVDFSWLVWEPYYMEDEKTRLFWIPPSKKELERPTDWDQPEGTLDKPIIPDLFNSGGNNG